MKKILFVTVFLITLNAYSQKNAFVINSDIAIVNATEKNIEQGDNNTTKQKRFTLNNRLGYLFAKKNLEFGITAGYSSSVDNINFSSFSSDDGERRFVTIQGGAYIRKYFPINNKFTFQLIADYQKSKDYIENNGVSDGTDIQTNSLSLIPGFVYFLSKKIALTIHIASLGYSIEVDKSDISNDTQKNEFHFLTGTSNINIGIAFYL